MVWQVAKINKFSHEFRFVKLHHMESTYRATAIKLFINIPASIKLFFNCRQNARKISENQLSKISSNFHKNFTQSKLGRENKQRTVVKKWFNDPLKKLLKTKHKFRLGGNFLDGLWCDHNELDRLLLYTTYNKMLILNFSISHSQLQLERQSSVGSKRKTRMLAWMDWSNTSWSKVRETNRRKINRTRWQSPMASECLPFRIRTRDR